MEEGHTLSFAIIDDLRQFDEDWGYGPIHVRIPDTRRETIRKAIEEIAKPFKKYIERRKNLTFDERCELQNVPDEEIDPTMYYFAMYFDGPEDDDINEAVDKLHDKGWHHWNFFEKYYVIAYAIDYKTFRICSKGNKPTLIQWVPPA